MFCAISTEFRVMNFWRVLEWNTILRSSPYKLTARTVLTFREVSNNKLATFIKASFEVTENLEDIDSHRLTSMKTTWMSTL